MPDDMPARIGRIEQILDAMNIPRLRVDGFEADDIIGTLAKKASGDKDVLQLLVDVSAALESKLCERNKCATT
jgi:DNA polymerase-1